MKNAQRHPIGLTRTTATLVTFGLGVLPLFTAIVSAQPLHQFYEMGDQLHSLDLIDFNGDGAMDIGVGVDNFVKVLINDGSGRFHPGASVELEGEPTDIVWSDFDNDGDADFAVVTGRDIATYRNEGANGFRKIQSGSFSLEPRCLAAADLDGDGFVDLVSGHGNAHTGSSDFLTHWNNGTGEFLAPFHNSWSYGVPAEIVPGDMDQDGDIDLVISSHHRYYGYYDFYDSLYKVVLANNGSGGLGLEAWEEGSVTREFAPYSDLVLGDVDGDGDLDVSSMRAEEVSKYVTHSWPQYFINDGGGEYHFEAHPKFEGGEITAGLGLADLDGDGDPDRVLAKDQVNVEAILNDRESGSFDVVPIAQFTEYSPCDVVHLMDVDGDGRHDIVMGMVGDVDHPAGVIVMPNPLDLFGPKLRQTDLVRGQAAWFEVSGSRTGEQVYFVYSTEGVGNGTGFPLLGGMTFDLNNPVLLLGSARVDDNRTARLNVTIPGNAPLVPIATQAVIRRGAGGEDTVKTNFQSDAIREN